MLSKYHQECIITNCADLFCLVCECYLLSEEDAARHINKPVHKKILAVTRYLENHEEDLIRQVPRGYYCEYCSIFISTSPKVDLHVADNSHNYNKGICRLKRINNNLIYNNLLIPEDNWHSLKDNSCSVCDVNFHQRDLHKSDPTHILNLMQKKIEFGAGDFVYRLIDDNTSQCVTCNTILKLKDIDLHVQDSLHIKKIKKCNDYYVSIRNNKEIKRKSLVKRHAIDIIDSIVDKMNKDVTRENDSFSQNTNGEENYFRSSGQYFETEQELNENITQENSKEKN